MTHLINIGCEKECKVMKKISQLIGNKLAKGGWTVNKDSSKLILTAWCENSVKLIEEISIIHDMKITVHDLHQFSYHFVIDNFYI